MRKYEPLLSADWKEGTVGSEAFLRKYEEAELIWKKGTVGLEGNMKKQNVRTLSLIVATITYLLIGAAIFDRS